jgi:hypothetical protein
MRSCLVIAALLITACGEPAVGVDLPEREGGQHAADLAQILDVDQLEQSLTQAEAAEGLDIVALTYETEEASCGEAVRPAREFVRSWDADIAVVAVARPGDFTSDAEQRQRCLGVQPLDDRAVPGSVREEIAEELVPPRSRVNDWDGAFAVAVETLVEQQQ